MPLDLDDPRLTAYALGELDESDRPALELQLNESESAREIVAQIRAMAALLTKTLADEAASSPSTRTLPFTPSPQPARSIRWLAMAASLLVGAGLGVAGMAILREKPATSMPHGKYNDSEARTASKAVSGDLALNRANQGVILPLDPKAAEAQVLRSPFSPPKLPVDGTEGLSTAPNDPSTPAPEAAAGKSPLVQDRLQEATSEGKSTSDPRPGAQSIVELMTDQNAHQLPAAGYAEVVPAAKAPANSTLAETSARREDGQSGVPKPQDVGKQMGRRGEQAQQQGNQQNQQGSQPGRQGMQDAKQGQQSGQQASPPTVVQRYNAPRSVGGGGIGAPSIIPSDVYALMSDGTSHLESPAQQAGKGQAGQQGQQQAGQQGQQNGKSQLGAGDTTSFAAALVPGLKEFETDGAREKRDRVPVVDSLQGQRFDQDRPPILPEAVVNNEGYQGIIENPFEATANQPLSTFSIDVDTASYANTRRFLNQNMMPPRDAVRIEEMVNYFPYAYESPKPGEAFSVGVEVARCPWNDEHQLAKIALKGRVEERKSPSNLVFLIDVSGSMTQDNKLPLVKSSLRMLVEQMTENDRVAIVVYAGHEGLALPSTDGSRRAEILSAIDQLESSGSTNGGAGITRAYDVAVANFIKGGVNRVILATDGDFNVGVTDRGALERLIIDKAKSGVFLSVLGVGTGNVKDATMETLADKGNGNYAYLDTLQEARKVLVEQMGGTLVTIAKDVKIQVDFNAARVSRYRLIGYENRALAAKDFADDTKDAGEIGAGHTVTALYELVPANRGATEPGGSKYAKPAAGDQNSPDLFTVKLRYKAPDGDTSKLIEHPVANLARGFQEASADMRFAASVVGFGMLLRGSTHAGNATYGSVLEWANSARGEDPSGYRREFVDLVRKAQSLQPHR